MEGEGGGEEHGGMLPPPLHVPPVVFGRGGEPSVVIVRNLDSGHLQLAGEVLDGVLGVARPPASAPPSAAPAPVPLARVSLPSAAFASALVSPLASWAPTTPPPAEAANGGGDGGSDSSGGGDDGSGSGDDDGSGSGGVGVGKILEDAQSSSTRRDAGESKGKGAPQVPTAMIARRPLLVIKNLDSGEFEDMVSVMSDYSYTSYGSQSNSSFTTAATSGSSKRP